MTKSIKGIQHKNGKSIRSTELEFYPEEPSRKDLTNLLLNKLLDAKEHYANKLLSLNKNAVPEEFLSIFFGLINEIEDFIDRYEDVSSHTQSGKSRGRKKNIDAMGIAIFVAKKFKAQNQSSDATLTGQYLFDNINSIINDMALRGEPCPMDVKLRTCQLWAKKIKEGSFP